MKRSHNPLESVDMAELRRQMDQSDSQVAILIQPVCGLDWGRSYAHQICRTVHEACRQSVRSWGHNPDRVCVRVRVSNMPSDPAFGGRLENLIGE